MAGRKTGLFQGLHLLLDLLGPNASVAENMMTHADAVLP